ncbi:MULTISPECIES: hypothetical protein [Aurantimonas]|uniref:hypothetical protein n=1 Tax=Aurantimonas TaxID=182269 RepID=UPI001651D87E|nr:MULTISPECIES: hypothetical protein [Aurantimonas]MBC6717052.1 hypothetical protein [Aurantimonas sp. DM33-3]MDE0922612.1 hypothetical protein [Aurantimonas coralicida]
MSDLLYVFSALLVGAGLLAVAAMFVAGTWGIWHQMAADRRARRQGDAEIRRMGRELRLGH